ncbi:MAG: glycosyltransferase family 4 protein [Chloroflexota bacterium]
MRLILFSHKLFYRTPSGLQTTGAFTLQMDALAYHCHQLTLCVPVTDDASFQGVSVTAPNINFHPLPAFVGRTGAIRNIPALRREILAAMSRADLGLVILPGYFEMLASWVCQRRNFPLFQWVVGDWRENVRSRRPSSWWTNRWTWLLDLLIARLTRDVLTFFNGRILYHNSPPPHHHTRTSSSIRLEDITERSTAIPLAPPYRLLFVGRLAAEKGVAHLLEALTFLADEPAELHLVGSGEQAELLEQQVQRLVLADRVHFHGFVPHGPDLYRLFAQSDLFILPALQDQQPKVLMEAMSQSVPVIATQVGGIPSVITEGENGLLVPPAEPQAIATAVRRLLHDNDLRTHLVKNGLAYVGQRTVEAETERMMRIVKQHFTHLESP